MTSITQAELENAAEAQDEGGLAGAARDYVAKIKGGDVGALPARPRAARAGDRVHRAEAGTVHRGVQLREPDQPGSRGHRASRWAWSSCSCSGRSTCRPVSPLARAAAMMGVAVTRRRLALRGPASWSAWRPGPLSEPGSACSWPGSASHPSWSPWPPSSGFKACCCRSRRGRARSILDETARAVTDTSHLRPSPLAGWLDRAGSRGLYGPLVVLGGFDPRAGGLHAESLSERAARFVTIAEVLGVAIPALRIVARQQPCGGRERRSGVADRRAWCSSSSSSCTFLAEQHDLRPSRLCRRRQRRGRAARGHQRQGNHAVLLHYARALAAVAGS